MVQTRSQTRAGAQAPPTLWPDAIVHPLPPPSPPPPPTLINVLTANNSREPVIPILVSLYQYLNGVDLDNLIRAYPFLRNALQHPAAPLPSFRCQDYPPLPFTKTIDPHSNFHMVIPQPPAAVAAAQQPCPIPPHLLIPHRRCEGPTRFGYTNNHGPNFWVCIHCVRRAWERYDLTTRPIGYDLCLPCSRNFRTTHPIPALDECHCQWSPPPPQQQQHTPTTDLDSDTSQNLYLCHTCREMHASSQHRADFDHLRGYNSNMAPIHVPQMGPFGIFPRPTRVADFINERGPWGESGCICGRNVTQKIATYPVLVGVPQVGVGVPRDFTELVRVCAHCRREKFVVPRFAF